MHRRINFSVVLALLLLALPCRISFADFVRDFDVKIRANRDASLDITETIAVNFDTPRHGIYRVIPVRYERYNNPFSITFRLLSIHDENNQRINYSLARQGNDINLKIGDKDVTVSGLHIYVIEYRVLRAVNFFSSAPEIYWNATGNEWPYPIRYATATLELPAGVTPRQAKTDCFIGVLGSTERGGVSLDDHSITYSGTRALGAGEGLTIVAGLPAGSIVPPNIMQELWWFLLDWWPIVFFPGLAFGFAYMRWQQVGRDVGAGTQAVSVEWEPPKDLSPAEVGTLIDETCDVPDVISTLIDLAARGWITIKEMPAERLLFFSNTDYKFTKVSPPPANDRLNAHEQLFLSSLFDLSSDTTRLSYQKQKFFRYIQPLQRLIYGELMEKNLFTQNPETVRGQWTAGGVVVGIAGIALLIWSSLPISFGIGLIAAGVVLCAFAKAMPAKTVLGTRKLLECRSFQRFVSLVERDRIKQMAMDDPTIFGRLLPYAMVLGVADQWAEAFKGLLTQPPNWYQSSSNQPFNSIWFMHNLGHGMRTMQQTMTSRPQQSSGAGGGHSGFGGGGFSGGGFGGGGGGSW